MTSIGTVTVVVGGLRAIAGAIRGSAINSFSTPGTSTLGRVRLGMALVDTLMHLVLIGSLPLTMTKLCLWLSERYLYLPAGT